MLTPPRTQGEAFTDSHVCICVHIPLKHLPVFQCCLSKVNSSCQLPFNEIHFVTCFPLDSLSWRLSCVSSSVCALLSLSCHRHPDSPSPGTSGMSAPPPLSIPLTSKTILPLTSVILDISFSDPYSSLMLRFSLGTLSVSRDLSLLCLLLCLSLLTLIFSGLPCAVSLCQVYSRCLVTSMNPQEDHSSLSEEINCYRLKANLWLQRLCRGHCSSPTPTPTCSFN